VLGAQSRRTLHLRAVAPAAPRTTAGLGFKVPGRGGAALDADGVADAATVARMCAQVTSALTELVAETQRKELTMRKYRGSVGLFQQFVSAAGLGEWFVEA
jgi:hypothetical protein